MVSPRLLAAACCPDCRTALSSRADAAACPACGRTFPLVDGFADLRPATRFAETTKYVEEALHADARHEKVSPPLLGAGVRNRMLRDFLSIAPGDRVIDLGCGSGRMLLWNRRPDAWFVGVDVSPFFAEQARTGVDLALADLRRLPFPDGTFTRAWSLDVFEHLSPDALAAVLAEAARVMAPGGELFVYSHVRRNSRLALGLRGVNAMARALERAGLIDMTQERLRKSDHLNPLADLRALQQVTRAAGFRLARIRFYTPLLGGIVENIFLRVAEHAMARRAAARGAPSAASDPAAGVREARAIAKRRIASDGGVRKALEALTRVMMLDVRLFGRVPSGPFFALFVKEHDATGTTSRAATTTGSGADTAARAGGHAAQGGHAVASEAPAAR